MHTPTPEGAVIIGIVNKLSKLIELWNPLHSPLDLPTHMILSHLSSCIVIVPINKEG